MEEPTYLIIAGAEKAGTTSLYTWLREHPDITGSRVKETNFFMNPPHPSEADNLAAYQSFFGAAGASGKIRLEASPSYLYFSSRTSTEIHRLLPQAHLIFLFRDPVDRLYSSFRFRKSRFSLPADLNFDAFVDSALAAADDSKENDAPDRLQKIQERALSSGRYGEHLTHFLRSFPAERIRVYDFNLLGANPCLLAEDVCRWVRARAGFFTDFPFEIRNESFAGRFAPLHRLALWANRITEPFSRKHPCIKQQLTRIYMSVNGRRQIEAPPAPETRRRLRNYYAKDQAVLNRLLNAHPAIDPLNGFRFQDSSDSHLDG